VQRKIKKHPKQGTMSWRKKSKWVLKTEASLTWKWSTKKIQTVELWSDNILGCEGICRRPGTWEEPSVVAQTCNPSTQEAEAEHLAT
jgi:hypothetical protein